MTEPEQAPTPAPEIHEVLRSAFAHAARESALAGKTLEAVAGRLNVALQQLDYLRKLSSTPELPDWHRTSGAWLVADSVSVEVSILVVAIRDALQKLPQPTAGAGAVH